MRFAAVAVVVLVALAGCASQSATQELAQVEPVSLSEADATSGTGAADDSVSGNDSEAQDSGSGDEGTDETSSDEGSNKDVGNEADSDGAEEEGDDQDPESTEESSASNPVEPVEVLGAAIDFPEDRVGQVSWQLSRDVSSRLVVGGVEVASKQGTGPHSVLFDVDRGVSVEARIEADGVVRSVTGTSPVPELQLEVVDVERSHDRIAFTVGIMGADDVEWRIRDEGPWSSDAAVAVTGLAPGTSYSFVLEARTLDGKATVLLQRTEETKHIPWATGEDIRIAPGIDINTPGGGCTGGFILTSPDNSTVYMTTAGHCITELGMPVDVGRQHDEAFGEAVAYNGTSDWALIEIYPEYRWEVSPVVLGLQKPTGVVPYGSTQQGEEVCISAAASNAGQVQQVRCGPFHDWSEDPEDGGYAKRAQYWGLRAAGDSGGPVMDSEGRALAIHAGSALVIGVGTSFEYALEQMEAAGFPVVLP